MIVKLLTGHYLEFLSLKGGCRGSSESTHCWKAYATAQMFLQHFSQGYVKTYFRYLVYFMFISFF